MVGTWDRFASNKLQLYTTANNKQQINLTTTTFRTKFTNTNINNTPSK